MAAGFSAAAHDTGDGTGAKIAQLGEGTLEIALLLLELSQ